MFGYKWFLRMGELVDASILGLIQDANELIHCSFSFYQGIDYRGQAQTSVRAGDIVLTYDGLPTREIIEWAMTSTMLYNGALVLCDANGTPIDKVFFEDGACVGMSVNYINDGNSSIITQLSLQVRKIITGKETLTQRWVNVPSTYGTNNSRNTSRANQLFQIAQPIGKISLDLHINSKIYEIERFKMDFSQGIDVKGQPQEETNGGIIEFSIANLPDDLFNKWMLKETEVKNGVFIFIQGEQESPLKVTFTQAYCINMAIHTLMGKGLYTDYVISANEIDLNGKWLYNNFKL